MKPKVFIGSSREGVDIADAIHANLTYDAECTVWKDGVFQMSAAVLSNLIQVLRESDFAVFVFSPDDISVMRGSTNPVVRDNVIFELGLFMGRLGPERCFFLIPDNARDLKLPSDLAGINPGQYEGARTDGNWMAALNPVCIQIKMAMKRLNTFQDAVPPSLPLQSEIKIASPEAGKGKGDGLISVEDYGKGILVKGDTKRHRAKLREYGASWNGKLSGWVLPASKKTGFLAAFHDVLDT